MLDLVYLRTSIEPELALAPIGPGEILWYPLEKGENIDTIVDQWRRGVLRTLTKGQSVGHGKGWRAGHNYIERHARFFDLDAVECCWLTNQSLLEVIREER